MCRDGRKIKKQNQQAIFAQRHRKCLPQKGAIHAIMTALVKKGLPRWAPLPALDL